LKNDLVQEKPQLRN